MKIRDLESYTRTEHLGVHIVEGVLPGESESTDYVILVDNKVDELDSEIAVLDPCAVWGHWLPADEDGVQSSVCQNCGE
ncbi:hypothetical protein J7438_06940 [Thalassotalea sp. G20_0]|uniref:hypothetical protein n=1 Tax=Thalassotalea sp. G20_0 TaxID=2821093 RepID=UPI001ADB4D8D|nr:hypothetical protein [Thalassotalea sp. G20_0]MBO9493820.1 hypothetical protein [Thalassotalea sp. G20_0]